MVSKSQIKLITALAQKKVPKPARSIYCRGVKGINEFLHSRFKLQALYVLEESADNFKSDKLQIISTQDLRRISALKNPQEALALFEIPQPAKIRPLQKGLTLLLDELRDPGNLGTIIRLCDWFGVDRLVCSQTTVDCYNPKVVQASMGSLGRVEVIYVSLTDYLGENKLPVYGAFMDGKNVHKENLPQDAILILGNEAHGISDDTVTHVDQRICIPQYHEHSAESLNVATAGAILLSAWRANS